MMEDNFKILRKEADFKPFFTEKIIQRIEEQDAKRSSIIEMLEQKIGLYKFIIYGTGFAAALLLFFLGLGYVRFENEKLINDTKEVANYIYSSNTKQVRNVLYKDNVQELINGVAFHSEFIEHELIPSETQCNTVREIILTHTKNNHSSQYPPCRNRYNILRSMQDAIMPLLNNVQREKFISKIIETKQDCC